MEFQMSTAGSINFSISAFLLLIAFISIWEPFEILEINTSAPTLYAMEHYKIYENGTKYADYVVPETGKTEHLLLKDWFDARLKGKFTYFFGTAFDNFCWIIEAEWFPSLFRASQLKPIVQVPLRAAVLLGICFRFFQALVIGFLQYDKRPSRITQTMMALFVLNELIYNISLFGISNYLVTPDEKYTYMFLPTLTAAYISFGVKMIFSFWHVGIHILTFLRLSLLLLISTTFGTIFTTTNNYIFYNYCDFSVIPIDGLMEFLAVSCLILSEVLDIWQCRSVQLRINFTEEDECGHPNCRDNAQIKL